MKTILFRTTIISLWVGVIFAALYFPKWKWLHYDADTINVFAWGDILDPAAVKEFEEETGIKVHLSYYSSNEELLVKLKATGGEGYDLVIPSDYAVSLLTEEGLLHQLDHSKLLSFDEINPQLLDHPFDPENRYSIPFEWEVFGLGIDSAYFATRPFERSWKLIFNPCAAILCKDGAVPYKIGMTNDFIEAIQMGSFYLFGPKQKLNSAEIRQLKALLIHQKKWVEAYANFRGDYLLATKNCPVVVASSSYILRTMRQFDFVNFVIPKEGSFMTIESLCIPKASDKKELAYQFINYLYRPKTVISHYETFGFFPALSGVLENTSATPQIRQVLHMAEQEFDNLHFTHPLFPEKEMRDLWIEVKSN